MKLIISFPQIVFERKVIEIPDEHFEEVQDASIFGQASFVYNQLTEIEQSWLPNGKESISSAMDLGYCAAPKPLIQKCPSTTAIIIPSGR